MNHSPRKHPPIKGLDVHFTLDEQLKLKVRMAKLFQRGYLMDGPYQEQLREIFKVLTHKSHAITFNSCTSAYECLLPYLKKYHKVKAICFQANIFPSPAFVAWKAGFRISWADISRQQMCPMVEDLQKAMEQSPFEAAVFQWTGGWVPYEVTLIREWCQKNGVLMIEDCSQALGSQVHGGVGVGNWGDVAISSLAGTKPHLHSGQGGMICTNDPGMALFVFQQKNYGRTEMFSKGKWVDMGHNFHMTEMQAVVGTVMAETMEKRISQREHLHKFGYGALRDEKFNALGNWSGRPNLYKFMIRLAPGVKSDFTEHLASHDIGLSTALYDFVTPHLEVWGGVWDGKEFPKTQAHAEEHVCLPMHNLLTTSDAQWVTGVVNRYFE